jgi:hypothetical protein
LQEKLDQQSKSAGKGGDIVDHNQIKMAAIGIPLQQHHIIRKCVRSIM